ncbi:MAG TPA: C2 family cysteine protease [Tepidisphaeraceae bacterium]|jgi:fibronectin type 3 domain-containing protein
MKRQPVGKSRYSNSAVSYRARLARAAAAIEGLEPRLFLSAAKPHATAAQTVTSQAAKTSSRVTVSTPKPPAVVAASSVLASATGPTSVQVTWSNVASATGYNVLKSTDGKKFALIGKAAGLAAPTFTDTATASNHTYSYEIQAFSTKMTAPVSKSVTVVTPLAAPSTLAGAMQGNSVQLKWTDNDSSATGYFVLRSTDGTHFSQIAKLAGASISTFSDNAVLSGHLYDYEIQAFSANNFSAPSAMAVVATTMIAPSGLIATAAGTAVSLTWVNKDSSATGYVILRSGDNVSFTSIGQINSVSSVTFVDANVVAGKAYYYEVKALNAATTSAPSNVAAVTTGAPNSPSSISIVSRFGNELVITATGANDSVSLMQSGSTLTITANGQTLTNTVPAAGIFIYTRGGSDSIAIASSVSARTTVDSIDGSNTIVNNAGSNVSLWLDSTDAFTGIGSVHAVASFAGGVTKAIGASLANPADSGATTTANLSLWGTGPSADDVNQGGIGDCYFLSSLAAFAGTNPAKLNESAVDLGDGTYAVQYFSSQNKAVYVRVSNSFSSGWFNGYAYAHPGANNTIWAMVMEKAFAYFRNGSNTIASISSGWMGEAYSDLGVANTFLAPKNFSESSFYATVTSDLANKKPITLAALNAPNVVNNHAYTLMSASIDSNGTTHYRIRNPWGSSGDALEDSHGYATLTFAQLVANFTEGCVAA